MFPLWLSRVLGKTTKPSRRQRRAARPATRPTFRPRLEILEDRTLLSASIPQTLPISIASSGSTMGNGSSDIAYYSHSTDRFISIYQEAINPSGQYVVFTSKSDNLVPGLVINGASNVYLRDLVKGTTSLVSISSDGTSGENGQGASEGVVTPDGRYVAFVSDASNLTSGPSNGRSQVYVRDMQQGQTYLVSLGTDGNVANGGVGNLSIAETGNGQQLVIAYQSNSTNLTSGDTNGNNSQIFVTAFKLDSNGNIEYNTLATKLASATSTGNGGDGDSADDILSKDGSTLAFESFSDNLAGETPDNADGHAHTQLFTYNVASGTLTQVSPTPPSGYTADSSFLSSISDNGQYLTYVYATNPYQPNEPPGVTQVLAWNANTGTNTVIDTSNPNAAFYDLQEPIISGDGSTIAFRDSNVDGGAVIDAARNWQSGGSVTQISPTPSSSSNIFSAQTPSISDNGQIIAYQVALNSGFAQIYVYNFNNATTTAISAASDGGASNGDSDTPEVSGDGSTVIYNSNATNLVSGVTVPNDSNGNPIVPNVYAYGTPSVQSAPTVTTNPSNQTVTAGQTAIFTAGASGNPTPTVQWQVSTDNGSTWTNLTNGTNVSGATSNTLTLNNTTTDMSGYEYQAVFTNSAGTATSNAATLTVNAAGTAPAITSGNSAAFTVGQGGSFTVTATGSPTPTLTESGALPSGVSFTNNGNGTATLSGTPAPGTTGTYQFTITAHNGVGSDATQSFTLTVNAPPPPPVKVPPLLSFFDAVFGGVETVNPNGSATITDSFFGIPLLVSTFDSSGNLVSVDLFGFFNITFLFL